MSNVKNCFEIGAELSNRYTSSPAGPACKRGLFSCGDWNSEHPSWTSGNL